MDGDTIELETEGLGRLNQTAARRIMVSPNIQPCADPRPNAHDLAAAIHGRRFCT
jgi:hypothetical protein